MGIPFSTSISRSGLDWASSSGTGTLTAYRYRLSPSGLSLEALRAEPRGIRVPLTTRYANRTVAYTSRQDHPVVEDMTGGNTTYRNRVIPRLAEVYEIPGTG